MRMIVSIFNSAVVDVRMLMGLPVVAMIMRVLHMLMIMLNVRVRVRHTFVRMLMGVRCGHFCPLFPLISIWRGPDRR
jgi:hypothetical protein